MNLMISPQKGAMTSLVARESTSLPLRRRSSPSRTRECIGRIPNRAHARQRAAEIAAALIEPLDVDGRSITALGSVGHAVATAGTPLGDLLGAADSRMYRTKHAKQARRVSALPTGRPQRTRDLSPPDHAA